MVTRTVSDFDQLTLDSIPRYIAGRPALTAHIDASALVSVVEVGDGNLNLVFIVRDEHGSSLVLKQSLPHVRTDPSWPMTRERSDPRVAGARQPRAGRCAPCAGALRLRPENYILAMEDLSDHGSGAAS